jgi:hypothetical protein
MPNQNDSPPVLSGTAPTQPDYILCKDMIDLQITNISGYNGLCVNFSAKDLTIVCWCLQDNRSGNSPNNDIIPNHLLIDVIKASSANLYSKNSFR